LDLFEYVWLTSFQITKKKHVDIRILLEDDITFPMLGLDGHRYVVRLAEPKKKNDEQASYLGLLFTLKNPLHRQFLWQTFKASVFHLSMHAAASKYEAYAKWSADKNIELTTFTVSMIEDAVVKAFLRTVWTPFMDDVALANTISYLKMKPVHLISNQALRVMASVISEFTLGAIKGQISEQITNDVGLIVSALNNIEGLVQEQILTAAKDEQEEDASQNIADSTIEQKLAVADVIYDVLKTHGKTPTVPSLLYTENHGRNAIYHGNQLPKESDVEGNLEKALSLLRGGAEPLEASTDSAENSLQTEIAQVFSSWEAKETTQRKILDIYERLGSNLRFRSYEFPREDFSEYLHGKTLLSSPIRRILERLRLFKNITGEDYRQEIGLLDMQEAIQVIASKSKRTDVFVQEELQTKEDAWAILIDASHSLRFFTGVVHGVALSLSEVARNLFTNQNAWSEYAFNDKFYIVKDFSENYTNRIRARIGGLSHGGMSYIPDALWLATRALKHRPEEMKLLVVVSDFFPSGYENAEDTLTECVNKIEKSGIGVIGIGVKSRAVRNYFRTNCVVDNPYQLMKRFIDAFFEFSSTV